MLRNWLAIVFTLTSTAAFSARDITLLIDLSAAAPSVAKDTRAAALENTLLSLPADARVRFFGFGRYTNQILPMHQADAEWKKQATELAKTLKFTARYADLSLAIQTALQDWRVTPGYAKEIILISSGQVKLPQPQSWNDALLNQIRGKDMPFSVLTLPKGDANLKLMAIAKSTKGSYAEMGKDVKAAAIKAQAILQPVLSNADIPVDEDRFYVDPSVNSMTLFLDPLPDSAAPVILGPNDIHYTRAEKINTVTWQDQGRQEVVVIQNPATGYWKIQSELNSKPKVVAKTYFNLSLPDAPHEIFNREKMTLQAALLNNKNIVSEAPILRDMVFSAQLIDKTGKVIEAVMNDDGQDLDVASDGIFTATFPVDANKGPVQIVIKAQGSQLSRMITAKAMLFESPVTTKVVYPTTDKQPVQILVFWNDLDATPNQKQTADVVSEFGERTQKSLIRLNRRTFLLTLPNTKNTLYDVYLNTSGKTTSGRDFYSVNKPLRVAVAGDATLSNLLEKTGIIGDNAKGDHLGLPALPEPIPARDSSLPSDLKKQESELVSKISDKLAKEEKAFQEESDKKLEAQASLIQAQTDLIKNLIASQQDAKKATSDEVVEEKATSHLKSYAPWVILLVLINILVGAVAIMYFIRVQKRKKTLSAMMNVLDNEPKKK